MNCMAGTALEAGDTDFPGSVRAAFAKAGAEVDILTPPADELTRHVREVAGRGGLIIAAGGDGTIQSVARGVLGTPAAMAVLPVGTFNHFAKELQMPLELDAAAQAIVQGQRQQIPVPMVNGEPFLSFAAVGLYARAIRHREAQRRARQRSKPLAMLVALWQVIRRPTFRRVRIEIGQTVLRRLTPSVIVACNEYQLRTMGLTDEFELDRNHLNLVITRADTRLAVLRFIFRGLMGNLQKTTEVLTAPVVRVVTRHRHEPVVLDGELATLQMPLNFAMSPVPLTVIVPPPALRAEAPASFAARR